MVEYLEQSVAGDRGAGRKALYVLCWVLVGVLLVAAIVCAANLFGNNPEAMALNWTSVIGLVLSLALALLVFLRKDRVFVEYDYLYQNDELEICVIWNQRRRKKLATIRLESVDRFGPAKGGDYAKAQHQSNLPTHKWYVHGEGLYYMNYTQDNGRHMALLELNDEMVAALRTSRELRRDAWRGSEGKYMQ